MTDTPAPADAGLIAVPAPRQEPTGARRDPLPLPGTPWSLRTSGGPDARPSLEMYAAEVLLDVVVASPLSAGILRGACAASTPAGPRSLAWGLLPADGAPLAVEFARPGLPPQRQAAAVTEVDRWFWLAMADGRFTTVTVTHRDVRERRRLRRVRQ